VNNGARGESLSFCVRILPATRSSSPARRKQPEAGRGVGQAKELVMATTPQPEVPPQEAPPQPSQAPEPAAPPPEVYPPQHDVDVPDPNPANPGPGTG
jgi:hypothetical protein